MSSGNKFDCLDINGQIRENRSQSKSKLQLAFLLTELYKRCLGYVRNDWVAPFPRDQEKLLLLAIEDQMVYLQNDLIRLGVRSRKNIEAILGGYRLDQDVAVKQLLVQLLLTSFVSVSEEILALFHSQQSVHERLKSGADAVVAKRPQYDRAPDYDQVLDVRRDVHSLYQIYEIADATAAVVRQTPRLGDDEKALVLQRAFQVIGEFVKNSDATPNLSEGVRRSLGRRGLPSDYLSEWRDLMAHHQFPVTHWDGGQIKQLFDVGLPTIKAIARSEILQLERNFVLKEIDTQRALLRDYGNHFERLTLEQGIRELISYIGAIKRQEPFRSLAKSDAVYGSVQRIYEIAQMMKSPTIEAASVQPVETVEPRVVVTSVTRHFHDNELRLYEAVGARFVDWHLDKHIHAYHSAHDDVLKVTNVLNILRHGLAPTPSDSLDRFLADTKTLDNLSVNWRDRRVPLKATLQRYFDAKAFAASIDYYRVPQASEVTRLVNIVEGLQPSHGTDKLTKFLKSVAHYQATPRSAVSPNDYTRLVREVSTTAGEIAAKFGSFYVDSTEVDSLIGMLQRMSPKDDDELLLFLRRTKEHIVRGGDIKRAEHAGLLQCLDLTNFGRQSSQTSSLAVTMGQVVENVGKLAKFLEAINTDAKNAELMPSKSKYNKWVRAVGFADGELKTFFAFRKQWDEVQSLLSSLNSLHEGSSKLTTHLASLSARQALELDYVPRDEYKQLLDGLPLQDTNAKAQLLAFSNEWERAKSLIDMLHTVDAPEANKSRLIEFLRSPDANQSTDVHYLAPDVYEQLVLGLPLDAASQEQLLLFSVAWRKRQSIALLTRNPPALKRLYDTIIRGDHMDSQLLTNLAYQYAPPGEQRTAKERRTSALHEELSKKINDFRAAEVGRNVKLLQRLSNAYAAEAQFINLYELLKGQAGGVDTVPYMVRKLRNYLAHVQENGSFREELFTLLQKALPSAPTAPTLVHLNAALDTARTGDTFAEIRKIVGETGRDSRSNSGYSKTNYNSCAKLRRGRSVLVCLFSRDDVERFSKGRLDDLDHVDQLVIDGEKFLTYVRNSPDEAKNAQLLRFVGDKRVDGEYRHLVERVVRDQGYDRYVRHERVHDLFNNDNIVQQQQQPKAQQQQQHDVNSPMKSSKLKGRLLRVAGGIQLFRAVHGVSVACMDGSAIDCGLGVGGITWSFAAQPIEHILVRTAPKAAAAAEKFVVKLVPAALGKQTLFAVRFASAQLGRTLVKGMAGVVGGVFDLVEIGMSAKNLVACTNRQHTDQPCSDKELRDNIASLTLSGVSFVAGVAFTAASKTGVGVAVGIAIVVGQGIYSGVSNIIEYEQKYDTTDDENWRIFWHTISFQPMPADVQHLASRSEIVNHQAKVAWQILQDSAPSVVACAIGLGEDGYAPALVPAYGQILMNRRDADTSNFSRVIPKAIANATMLCLPQSIDKLYEKKLRQSVPSAIHYCENTIVIADERRLQQGNTVLYNLQNIDKGIVVGSDIYKNDFFIFGGTTRITGGKRTVNRFILNGDIGQFSGRLIGGQNATNIFDLSQRSESMANVRIAHTYSGNLQLNVWVNQTQLYDEFVERDPATFKYVYLGRAHAPDTVHCTYTTLVQKGTTLTPHNAQPDSRNVFVDGGGGSNASHLDTVENCLNVAVLPYTRVSGGAHEYTFEVRTGAYHGTDLYAEIGVQGRGTVSFPEINLLKECRDITYTPRSNTLTLQLEVGAADLFTVDMRNYMATGSGHANFMLIDKYGNNIVPRIAQGDERSNISTFEVYGQHSLHDLAAVEQHYQRTVDHKRTYDVFAILADSAQQTQYMFGSAKGDVMNALGGSMYARGGNGSDAYIVDTSTERRDIQIDNGSEDRWLDVLVLPQVPRQFTVRQCDLHLSYQNTHVRVRNYTRDRKYGHLMVMGSRNADTFIPYVRATTCDTVQTGTMVHFLHATPTQNMFVLRRDFGERRVAIDAQLGDIERYRDNQQLLVVRYGDVPFVIKIEDFYDERVWWQSVEFLLWHDGAFTPYEALHDEVDDLMPYVDKLRDDYVQSMQEYVVDFAQSLTIAHNQAAAPTRVAVLILKDITPQRVQVTQRDGDLQIADTATRNVITVRNWSRSQSYRLSTLEFDLGLEPLIVPQLERYSAAQADQIQALIVEAAVVCQRRDETALHTALPLAVQDGDFAQVIALLGRCASVNAKGRDGLTALHYAATVGNLDAVQFMVQKGVDLNALSGYQQTAMYLAATHGHLAVVRYLRERGASHSLANSYGQTPLHSAAITGRLDVVRYLVEVAGAQLNQADMYNRTPLALAAKKGHADIVDYIKRKQSGRIRRQADLDGPPPMANGAARTRGLLGVAYKGVERLGALVNGWLGGAKHFGGNNNNNNDGEMLPFDTSGTLLLLDTLVRKLTGQKYIATPTSSLTEAQTHGHAINITYGFEKIIKLAARRCEMPVCEFGIDFPKVQADVARRLACGRYAEISAILHAHAASAISHDRRSPTQIGRFMSEFTTELSVLLNASMSSLLMGGDNVCEPSERHEGAKFECIASEFNGNANYFGITAVTANALKC